MLDTVQHIISDGLLVALSSCCLLHYIHTVIKNRQTKEKLTAQENLIVSNQGQISNLVNDQKTRELENQILREMLPKNNATQSLSLFLERLLPGESQGLCGFFSADSKEAQLVSGRGALIENACWQIPPDIMEHLEKQGSTVVQRSNFNSSGLTAVTHLTALNNIDEIYLIAQPDQKGNYHLLMTTELFPVSSDRQKQIEFLQQIIQSVGFQLRQAISLKQEHSQSLFSQNKIKLIEILNNESLSPVVNIQNYISVLTNLTDAFRANLHLTESDGKLAERPLIRACHETEPNNQSENNWIAQERIMANLGILSTQNRVILSKSDLYKININDKIQNAIISRLEAKSGIIPIFSVLKHGETPFNPHDEKLILWAANTLSSYLMKSLNHALIKKSSCQDGLTRLANRRAFDEQLLNAIQLAQNEKSDCALILLDIDHFKSINDNFGHTVGDLVLKETAELLSTKMSKFCPDNRHLVARYGGEEMAIILPEKTPEEAYTIADQLRAACADHLIEADENEIHITMSAGVANYSPRLDEPLKLIEAADIALYEAKTSGRNRVVQGDKLQGLPTDESQPEEANSSSNIEDLLHLAQQRQGSVDIKK